MNKRYINKLLLLLIIIIITITIFLSFLTKEAQIPLNKGVASYLIHRGNHWEEFCNEETFFMSFFSADLNVDHQKPNQIAHKHN